MTLTDLVEVELNELHDIISEETLKKVWGSAHFGMPRRDVVRMTLLKRASGFHTGYTATTICVELGLLTAKAHKLTRKGGKYLWEAFRNGSNF